MQSYRENHYGKANANVIQHFTENVLNGSVQFTAVLHLRRRFILSAG